VPQVVQPKQALILPVRYQYYQSDATLSISVLAKNLATEDVVVDIQPEHLRVVIKYVTFAGENKEEVVIDKALYASVDVTKSKFVVLKPKVEITLVKIEKEQWGGLEHTGEARLPRPEGTPLPEVQEDGVEMDVDGNAVTATTTLPNKRPKPYASNKDWDKVSSEIAKDLEKEKKEADDGANSVLAELYKGMDPESQRAMQKSFQTSGGTVLSTNWKEVKDTDYESAEHRQAPKGMEWRNWEGDKLKQRED
jgi:suppressor of G2 allele of SKP1